MRILTRADMDGLTSSILLSLVEEIREIRFAHPKDVQDGEEKATKQDIVVNLPYVKGCGRWFDHHASEQPKLKEIGKFEGRFALAPSTARLIYEYYRHPDFEQFKDLLEATDRLDSAQLTTEDVTNPKGWILLGLTLDPRTGLGPGFRKYFRWLVEYIKEVPIDKILQHREVRLRCSRVLKEIEEFRKLLTKHSHQEDNVIITDFRGLRNMEELPVGNRFLVYAMYPTANVEVRTFVGRWNRTVIAVGRSIFNRTCKVNIGKMLSAYGGGGLEGAGTCQLSTQTDADKTIAEIISRLKG